ncbi:TetR family transcriptional regulator [Amycolatopsis sp. EV170708-02-1]|uniref:TetR family transcriptional regulator n=1 Tax=Amycolatopsis sp. EV170708-02-1 TaxID=2919322 RepID=UPI001F0BCF8A|nr:TetR family transcriptional regulator [Amycolatopsis sp. EV170708-02-1]UMP07068.1 TetR family transcriptional regulator [Amycolatopsis sp. EV170708-02-1]
MEKLGLRERKKQRTREALIDAAQALFCTNGFEATTIDQIAESVEVSSRTFFRYFASKEDVALALADEQITVVLKAFAAQPAHLPVLTAMRTAAVEIMRTYETDTRFHRLQNVISVNPALTAARIDRATARFDEAARLIGGRMGVDPAADPRPYLVASVALCAVQTAVVAWRAAGQQAPESELTRQAFDLLSTGLDYPAGPTATGH